MTIGDMDAYKTELIGRHSEVLHSLHSESISALCRALNTNRIAQR